MIYASAEALSTSLTEPERKDNWMYPDIRRIREVSVIVTRGVIRAAQKDGVDRELALRNVSDEELEEYVKHRMYDPFTEHEKVDAEIEELVGMVEESKRGVKGSGSGMVNRGGRERTGSSVEGKAR